MGMAAAALHDLAVAHPHGELSDRPTRLAAYAYLAIGALITSFGVRSNVVLPAGAIMALVGTAAVEAGRPDRSSRFALHPARLLSNVPTPEL